MNNVNPSWLARLFASAELSQLSEALQEQETALASAHAQQAELDREHQILKANAVGMLSALDTGYAHIEFDTQGLVLKANDRFCQLLGYTPDEIVGQHHRVFVDPAFAGTQTYRDFWAALNAGLTQTDVFKRVGKGGQVVWIQATYAPVKEAGRVVKVIKIATDVTATKLEAANWSGQIDAIGKAQAVIEFGLDGKVLTANDNFLTTLGYSLDEVRGQHHSLFVDPVYRSSPEYRLFWDKLGRGEYDAGQYKRIGKGGREVWIQASYNPILDLNGKPFKVVKYATDITAQKLQAADWSGQIEAISKAQAVIEFGHGRQGPARPTTTSSRHWATRWTRCAGSTTACLSIRSTGLRPSTASSGTSWAAANTTPGSTSASARAARRSGSRPPTTPSST